MTELEEVLAAFERVGFPHDVVTKEPVEFDDPKAVGMPFYQIHTWVTIIEEPGEFQMCFNEVGEYLGLYDDYFGGWHPRKI